MTEAKIKEELAIHFLSGLAARMGFISSSPRIDEGVDLVLERLSKLPVKDRNQFTPSGAALTVQLKTTTRSKVSEADGHLMYDLKRKNYDDLIFRKNLWNEPMYSVAPLILILLVLPDENRKWIEVDLRQQLYQLRGLFYWYYPDEQEDFSTNKNRQRIKIPTANKIDLGFFDNIFNLFYQTDQP